MTGSSLLRGSCARDVRYGGVRFDQADPRYRRPHLPGKDLPGVVVRDIVCRLATDAGRHAEHPAYDEDQGDPA